VYRALPPRDRARTMILAGNYGEAGAIDLLDPAAGLPAAISPHNTYYRAISLFHLWRQPSPKASDT